MTLSSFFLRTHMHTCLVFYFSIVEIKLYHQNHFDLSRVPFFCLPTLSFSLSLSFSLFRILVYFVVRNKTKYNNGDLNRSK